MNLASPAFLVCVLATSPIVAQCFGIPDTATGTGNCNLIPFGDGNPTSTTWSNQIYQTLIPAADLNSLPGVITGLAIAPCSSGIRHFQTLTIKMGHCNLGSMTTTYAANFTTPPITVLDVADFRLPVTADVWNKIPLQQPFTFIPPLGDLLIEVIATGAGGQMLSTTNAGLRTGARPRLFNFGWTPPAVPTTGTWGSTAALKMEVCLGVAGTAVFGTSCPGSNSTAPALNYSGTSQIGQTLNVNLSNARASSPYFTTLGRSIAPPLPFPLDVIGMTGCKLYTDILVSLASVTNASGNGTTPIVVPNDPTLTGLMLFNQSAVVDPPANQLGLVTSNAGWFVIGN